jgi:hypothetical protein
MLKITIRRPLSLTHCFMAATVMLSGTVFSAILIVSASALRATGLPDPLVLFLWVSSIYLIALAVVWAIDQF